METIHILLVEDNEGDILLTQDALEEAKILTRLSVVKDGKEAIDFLTRQQKYLDAELPDLILLDVNLPKKNGHEVLRQIKGDDALKCIPVIMLTTSSTERDINLAYNNYANCYITKPVEASDFLSIVNTIENFWIAVVKLPQKNNHR
jgi:CheY-like chemotaxis protein